MERLGRTNPTLWAVALALLAAFPIVPAVPWPPASIAAPGAPGPDPGPRPATSVDLPGFTGLSVSIALPGRLVEPNVPFSLAALPGGGIGSPLSYAWNDSLGTAGTNRTIVLLAPSAGSVSASVTVRDDLGDSASASATVGVGEAPAISLSSALGATDVGLPIPLTIRVNGSFAPYSVTWAPLPSGAASAALLQGPGSIDVATWASAPGYAWIQATVTDHMAVSETVDSVVAVVHPRPQVLLTASPSEIDAGTQVSVTGLVVGGTPPFSWSAAASLPVTNVTGATGEVGTDAPLEWAGELAGPGEATVRVDLADAVGVLLSANVSVRVFP
ncbi:MAG TPA: PKD domain-containing protein, partial [Thermoplasmata archaeon]|nr:PKD domain-containing protein [Thermoplasmata archaeon]